MRTSYTPVYIVTGFLYSGKTTFLNMFFNRQKMIQKRLCIIQFEAGEAQIVDRHPNHDILYFSKKELELDKNNVVKQINEYLLSNNVDEIWVEWNGVTSFSTLQSLFFYVPSKSNSEDQFLGNLCKIQKVINIVDISKFEVILGKVGSPLIEQIANSDLVIARNFKAKSTNIKRTIHSINKGVKICPFKYMEKIDNLVYQKKLHPINGLCVSILLFMIFYSIFRRLFNTIVIPVDTTINIFLGILLQGLPFLMIGVILSSLIQVFISKELIEKKFPKGIGTGILFSIIAGFCLPVCDCASIPIFRSIVKKGVPLTSAIVFLLVAPIVNPVVILSTYVAFNGNIKIVFVRICLGIITSVLVGLVFAVWKPKGEILTSRIDNNLCNCGCFEGVEYITTLSDKISLFMRHSQMEFFNVGKFLMIGAFVSSCYQVFISNTIWIDKDANLYISIITMMLMAFFLSLCSSSDATVARSFATKFPVGSIMGFLVFGPMIDIKNVIMLSSGFSPKFIVRLAITTFLICFSIVSIFFSSGLGGYLL
ncbi:permease [Clostridioides mangenotii]|uniref:permease n=1 Tax=Metaclostridioides mangenotii TaxID=1540 RepID=UPI001C10F0B1|nr:permease [Clostridioides mangenotii]MBU5308634.1 permease [Clostridioides mangenotii]